MPARRCGHRGVPPLVIYGYSDAVSAAREMANRFARCHGVVVTDARGLVIELLVLTGDNQTAEDAIVAGLSIHRQNPAACRMMLVSILHGLDASVPNELEVDGWEEAVERCRRRGVELWEWVVCSGEVLRCLSLTAMTQHVWRWGGTLGGGSRPGG